MPSKVETGWNDGEISLHRALKAPSMQNPTAAGLPQRYHWRIAQSPLMALGTVDDAGRPWTSVWGGERAFARAVAADVIGISSGVSRLDPVFETLWAGDTEGDRDGDGEGDGVVEMGRLMSGLAIDLETRDRVKLMGEAIAGAAVGEERVQMAFHITGSLGNCPKYLNKKEVVPHDTRGAELVPSDGMHLGEEALALLGKADLFFMSTTDGESMDTNHRGGKPGFVRVFRNETDSLELVYPEYSGNRLYQSLGNMEVKPLVGLVIPDFETGDALYLTGTTQILIGKQASALIAHSNLAVRISVAESRFVRGGLPFRASVIDYSPYNPPLRYLTSEKPPEDLADRPQLSASLVARETLTPTISRLTFRLSGGATWRAGQHVTLDFGPELDNGYAHMKDDDPQSLNDDFVRTFTVSSVAPVDGGAARELQITARRHGPATDLLMRQNLRAPLDLGVLGFGGKDEFQLPTTPDARQAVFIAGGVGITPMLAQGQAALDAGVDLTLLWTVRGDDVPLVEDTFRRIPGLARVTKLFITGTGAGDHLSAALGAAEASVEGRRIQEADVARLRGAQRRFYLCAPSGLIESVNRWLEGEDVVWEDFGY